MSTYSLDEDNKRIYKARATEWEEKAKRYIDIDETKPSERKVKSNSIVSTATTVAKLQIATSQSDIAGLINRLFNDTISNVDLKSYPSDTNQNENIEDTVANSEDSGIIKKKNNIVCFENEAQARDYIKSNKQPKTIFMGSQKKHIEGTKEYNDYVKRLGTKGRYGPSRLTISIDEAQRIVDEYHGTGFIKMNSKGEIISERITINNKIVGISTNDLTGKEVETDTFLIKYSKKGTHLIPTYPIKRKV